jgi:DNA primase
MSSGDSVQKIKERLSIVDVVSPYVELHQAGKNFKGKSPFTNERTPSFYVSPDRGMYYCFSSSQGGDIFTFIQKMEGVEFKDALKILADKAGVELVPEDPQKKSERERMYEVLEEATKFFESYKYTHGPVLEYLTQRGVSSETIARWRIGYAPGAPHFGWRELKEHLEKKGYTKDEMLLAGLIKGADQGKEPYDVFRDRVMFPIFDPSGRVVAFSGRILSKDSEAPKYVNSPETELFNKSETLYGYHIAKQGIRTLDFALAVEGQFDVVLCHQAGYSNTVAVSGTALTAHHVQLLQRLSNKVVLALDADKAGIAAVRRSAELMLPRGIDLKVARIIGGKDPADMIAENPQHFKAVVGGALPVVEYFLDILEAQKKDERAFKLQVREEVLPLVVKIGNKIDQDHFENVIAARLNTTKEAIHFEVERIAEQERTVLRSQAQPTITKVATEPSDEIATSQALRKEELLEHLVVLVSVFPEDMRLLLEKAVADVGGVDVRAYTAQIPSERLSALSFTLESHIEKTPTKQLYSEVVDRLNAYHRLGLKETLAQESIRLREAEEAGDRALIDDILKRISMLQRTKSAEKYTIDMFL